MTTFSTNPYFIFQRFECYTTLIVKELLYNNKIKFFSSTSKSVVTYITIAVTNIIKHHIIKQHYGIKKSFKVLVIVTKKQLRQATGIPTYKLANFLVPKLSSITFNDFTVKDSFAFAEEIVYQDAKLFMGSLNVDSLFTSMPLKETINICTNLLYNNVDVIEGTNKSEFENLPSLATQELHFMVNNIFYKQKDGVAMGSPLGPTAANVF